MQIEIADAMLFQMRAFPNNLHRRGILGAGVSAGILGATGIFAQVPKSPDAPLSSPKVNITLGGATYSYPGGPTLPDYRVSFHSDGSVSGRYGSLGSAPRAALGPYTVNINGKDIAVPSHGWFQQWTWRSAPLTVKKKPAEIVAANRSFAFGDIGLSLIALPTLVFAGPMDNAGIQKSMNAGGFGSDRCLITDYAAHFMRTGNPASMFAQALAADSIPINYVDVTTGKLPDLIAHPLTNSYGTKNGSQYKPFFPSGPLLGNDAGDYATSGGWTPTTDHFPELTYIAFQASHDLGLLFNKQAAATFHFTSEPGESGVKGVALIQCLQHRQLAWGLRDLFQAHVMTLDAEALGLDMTGLHPSSYWKTLIDNQLRYRSPIMNDPRAQTFRLIDIEHILHWAPWQYDYLLSTLAFAVLSGHADWKPLYLWCLGNVIARTNGTSGWPPGLCTAYKVNGVVGGADPKLPHFTWAQAFDNQLLPSDDFATLTQAQYDAIRANPLKLSPQLNGGYLGGCYSVLLMADYLDKKGLATVRAAYPDFDTCLANVARLMKSYGKVDERFSIVTAG